MAHMLRYLLIVLAAVSCCLAQDDNPAPTIPAPTIPELETAAQASYMHGDYEVARQSLLQAWDLAQQAPREDPIRYDVLKRLAAVRATAGEFADADNFLQLAISWREQNLGLNDPKTVDDVLLSVAYARGLKDFERALLIMNRVLGLHLTANRLAGLSQGEFMNSITVADDFSRMAQIQAEMAKLEPAIGSLNTALAIRTKLLGPLDPSLVYDLDRLGGLQVTARAYDKAEETYRHALVVRETLYGKTHADLISTVDGLAYALFGQKKYDEAEPVYQRLLALWITSVGGETHPMVAIALDKIAVFYSTQKKWDQARDATTRANAIRAYILADGLSGEASQRIDEGKMAEAIPVYQRALKVLDVPNPIYDEQRAVIAAMEKELEKVVKKPPTQAPLRSKK
jgi:tetratricopeptide (TPR) repeat protein